MITVRDFNKVDLKDVLRRSPVGDVPQAEKTMRECMLRSIEVRCGMLDDKVACMWGLIPPTLMSDRAYLWLLTTDIVAEHKFLFVRYSQRYVEQMLEIYPCLYGEVLVTNLPARKWLKWLGAEFGAESKGVMPFVIKRKTLNG